MIPMLKTVSPHSLRRTCSKAPTHTHPSVCLCVLELVAVNKRQKRESKKDREAYFVLFHYYWSWLLEVLWLPQVLRNQNRILLDFFCQMKRKHPCQKSNKDNHELWNVINNELIYDWVYDFYMKLVLGWWSMRGSEYGRWWWRWEVSDKAVGSPSTLRFPMQTFRNKNVESKRWIILQGKKKS